MAYRILIHPAARDYVNDLPDNLTARIYAAIKDKLGQDPQGPWAEKLKGYDLWRLRVGDYRVIYRIDEDGEVTVVVVRIGHRRDIYEWLNR